MSFHPPLHLLNTVLWPSINESSVGGGNLFYLHVLLSSSKCAFHREENGECSPCWRVGGMKLWLKIFQTAFICLPGSLISGWEPLCWRYGTGHCYWADQALWYRMTHQQWDGGEIEQKQDLMQTKPRPWNRSFLEQKTPKIPSYWIKNRQVWSLNVRA